MNWTSGFIGTKGLAEETPPLGLQVIEQIDNLKEIDVFGGTAETKSPVRSAHGRDQTCSTQRVENLGKIILGNAGHA
jgi:hypothetical protein